MDIKPEMNPENLNLGISKKTLTQMDVDFWSGTKKDSITRTGEHSYLYQCAFNPKVYAAVGPICLVKIYGIINQKKSRKKTGCFSLP